MLPLLTLVALSASTSAAVATQSSSGWSRGFDGARESFLETVLEANVSNQKSCKVRRLQLHCWPSAGKETHSDH